MRKQIRKSISVLLSLLMVLSVFGGMAFTASAADIVVTFVDSDGVTPLADAQTIAAGTAAAKPADPTKEDCFFRGWKLPDEYKYYDFVTPLDEATTLTAVWEEGTGFFRDDFQTGIGAWTNETNAWTLETEGGNRFVRFSGGADTGYLVTPVFDVSAVKNNSPRYMYVEFLYRNPAAQAPGEPGGSDGHSDVIVKYRFANSDAEGTWRTDHISGATYDAHDGWTRCRAMLFFYPQWFSYEDTQFGFVTDGNEGVVDVDEVYIYYGGHDFDFNFGYDEDTYETLLNEVHGFCRNGFCTLDADQEICVTINAPEKKYADDDKSPAATMTGLDGLIFYTGKSVPDEISYVSMEDEEVDLPGAPADPGFYAARVFIWNSDLGIEYPYMELRYAIGYTLTYGQTLADITLPNENYAWADGVQTDEVLDVGEYAFDVDLTIAYQYWSGSETITEYNVQTLPMPVRVLPKPITVTARAAEKTEGENDPALTYDAVGLLPAVPLNGELARDPGETAGTYAITQGTITDANNPCYTITYVGANLTINAKQVPDNPPDNPPQETDDPPVEPDTPDAGTFRCQMCPMYEECKDIPYFGWVVSLVHIFVHLAAHIGYIT